MPRDKKILCFTSFSLMSSFSQFCLEAGHPQLLTIHLSRDSFTKCDELHWRDRNNAPNFCLMNFVFVCLKVMSKVPEVLSFFFYCMSICPYLNKQKYLPGPGTSCGKDTLYHFSSIESNKQIIVC